MRDVPLSLYVHWPWCVRKCPYCDFNSHKCPPELPEERFFGAMIRSLEAQSEMTGGRKLETIFIGGGTPSLMSVRSLDGLLGEIRRIFRVCDDAEITMEANPGTFELEKFKGFRLAGVNRLSVGVQSFNDRHLRALGRIHSSEQAKRTLGHAAEVFGNFNIDLMFGLPGQSVADLDADLAAALGFGSTHLSCYQLTIEPNTYFYSHLPAGLPDEDALSDMQDLILDRMAGAEFEHYEVSGYAKAGRKCRHNLNYWQYGDYLGAGPGAHGKITVGNDVIRTVSQRDPAGWMNLVDKNGTGFTQKAAVAARDIPFEFMLNALRLLDGVPAEYFEDRTPLSFSSVRGIWDELASKGLVEGPGKRLKTTELGMRFLNEVQEAFL